MGSTLPYERELNAPQLEAVTHDGPRLLVLAGAGSGKTRVITYRIAYLVRELGVDPSAILAVTFTNKAAGEMKERVRTLLGPDADVWIRTFHSTAAKLLRTMGGRLGVRGGFTIIDQQDQYSLVKRVMKELKIDPEVYKPEKFAHLIGRAKDSLLDAGEALNARFSGDPLFYEIYRCYEERLGRENLLDFGDLIGKLSKGLDRSGDALASLRNRFRYVLVDEFQDTNYAQYVLVKQLTLPDGNVSVVGDDDQSIYGFRGAKVENILNFPKDYPGTRVVKLEENYRSFQTILSASTHVINHNHDRLGKTLFTSRGEGEKIVFFRASSDLGEAHFIAGEIRDLVYRKGYDPCDIAVFYRMNAQSRVLESVFSRARIPYTIVGGLRFFEREEIKDMLAYLRLAVNPFDEISLRRIANKPPRGIGDKTVDAVVASTVERGLPIYGGEGEPEVAGARVRLVREFLETLSSLGETARSEPPPAALKKLYKVTGYLDWLESEGKEEKLKNLEELYNAVDEFRRKNPEGTVSDFIEEASLNQGPGDEEQRGKRVFLITLHNAKGLEFPVVFMAGMEDGVFPHYLSGENREDVQEERRLCYVGMTRAMEKLYLTAARVRRLYGRSVERGVSSFVFEVPKELLLWNEEAGGGGGLFEGREETAFPRRGGRNAVIPKEGHRARERRGGARSGAPEDLDVNSRVVHKSFGRGVVLSTDGKIAEIRFDDGKLMKFMLKYTPLSRE